MAEEIPIAGETLLACGVAAGQLFFVVAVAQMPNGLDIQVGYPALLDSWRGAIGKSLGL